jgi:predicted ATPase/transcriptional regulator with XRE-family HTH domain
VLREHSGLTQEELAARAGLTPHAVSALERGTRTRPYPHTVRSLVGALGLSDEQRSSLIASVPTRRVVEPAPVRGQVVAEAATIRHAGRLLVPPTRIYGRDEYVAAVVELIRSGARMVTLTGPGGVGKTRLAAATSAALAADYPDGVVQINLAVLVDPAALIPTIGCALGIAASDGPDALDIVTEHLQSQQLLLVLDNFEHLLTAAADIGRLSSLCPDLTVLISSRSPLRVRGEREHVVAPLDLPPTDATTVDELVGSAAGALVLDRSRQVTQLDLDADDVAALSALCHRLAGLPLAIELATAHLRLLTPTALLHRLEDVTVAAGARDLPERQRTMRATLDWSYRLLEADQQKLFRLLGIFRAGAALDAVEDVIDLSGELPRREVLGLLELLAEHSLLSLNCGPDGRDRIVLLEPVAQYARSLLVGSEAVRVGQAHAQIYLRLAERAAKGYEGPDQVLWLARTQADEANILVAIDRSLDAADGDTAGRITWAMWLYWWLRSEPSVGRKRAEKCLEVDLSPAVLGRVHLAAATMSYASGDVNASREHWAEAFRLGSELGDTEVTRAGRAGSGLAALGAGDLDTAEKLFRDSLEIGRNDRGSGRWLRSLVHVWLGTVLLLKSDPAAAIEEIERGHRLARTQGDRLSTYVALYNLSQAAIALGNHHQARTHLTEGIALSQQTQDLANLAYFLDALAVVEAADAAPDRVAVLLGAAQTLRERVGAKVYGYYLPDESLRAAAERQTRAALGEDAFDDAVDAGRALDPDDSVRYALRTYSTASAF